MSPEQFEISFPQAGLDDLKRRLRSTNWAQDFGNDDWGYGVNGDYLRGLVDYWLTDYDWPAQQAALNANAHFRTEIDGMPVHYMHVPGKGPNPIPMMMIHGWPWTFWDYHKVMGALADPASYGGDPADAFDLYIVSMPGFGFSSPLTTPGVNSWVAADTLHKLMTDVLGFERYAVQGGDWGAFATTQIGHKYWDSLIGLHLTSTPTLSHWNNERPWDVTAGRMVPEGTPDDVRAQIVDVQHRIAAHVAVHMLDAQTLAYALQDSPVGLLAWLVRRRYNWSHCPGGVESVFSKDFLLTTTMIYWFTKTIGTSMRLYAEAGKRPWSRANDNEPLVKAPTGVTYLEFDVGRGLGRESEQQFNMVYSKEHKGGGHFVPMENPQAVIDDVRATFRGLR
ncbi:MAG: epoxide hydrolase family protein [Alphaproteobacteria bacterium]